MSDWTPTFEPLSCGAGADVRAAPESGDDSVSLCEALDRVLNKGVVLRGEITISVANIDLLYLGMNVLLGSCETIRRHLAEHAAGQASGHTTKPAMERAAGALRGEP